MSVSAHERLLDERYELDDLLGAGGMAEVRRAWDTRLHRHVAVKLFRAGSDVADAARFENEIKTLAALSHPGLVQVHDAGTTAGTPFVVLQMVDGQTLFERIANGPLEVDEVRRLGAELADALAYVHAKGVMHRDIKPSNILLDRDGNAHLADFGLATLVDATRLTRPDQLVGTAAYLSPEQVRGEKLTCAVDVYALGLVLLECLTGRREYQGSEVEAAVARLHRRPDIPRGLPADLKRLLTLMTSLSPRRRPDAAECARLLREVAPTRVALPQPSRSQPSRSPVRMLVAAGAFALVATTTGVMMTLNSASAPAESAPPTTTTAPETPVTPVVASVPPTTSAAAVVPVQANQKVEHNRPAPAKPEVKAPQNHKPKSKAEPGHGSKAGPGSGKG
ncbi:serine/threonine-protein kinase [Nocardia sp. NRRL S-836]|uniref:serine/threonine-protein kinase n=1 Tax=Nocardia sp. NRRL S-836 TaxID=1519492 RepID=UPI0006AD9E8B|nr:serine/threonine-protein kinase [Nocardia sp. NRRL S-836]